MKYPMILVMPLLTISTGCAQQDTTGGSPEAASTQGNCGTELMVPGAASTSTIQPTRNDGEKSPMTNRSRSEEEWKRQLSPQQFRVLREKGTEPAFTGAYYKHDRLGNYHCAGCGSLLFTSNEKYHSGSGWPSFFAPADAENLVIQRDASHGMVRDEVLCAHCGGHLGHVFDDGPKPTGLRYCINSISLDFKDQEEEK